MAAAAGGGGGLGARGLTRRHPLRLALTATAVGATVGGAATAWHHRERLLRPRAPAAAAAAAAAAALAPPSRLLIPQGVADVVCGAVGEIVQVACLYPLDTLKVRCQVQQQPAARVVADMVRAAGGPLAPALWRQLYAGVVGASVLSVAVGALYYSSFCAAKRRLLRMTADGERRAAARAAEAAAADALPLPPALLAAAAPLAAGGMPGAAAAGVVVAQHAAPPAVDYHHDAFLALLCSDDAAARRAAARSTEAKEEDGSKQRQRRGDKRRGEQQQAASAAPALAAGGDANSASAGATANAAAAASSERVTTTTTTTTTTSASSEVAEDAVSSAGRVRANLGAAMVAALVGAVVEAPVELFKHQLQAGAVGGSILGNMQRACAAGGPGALFVSVLPFAVKSLPFDATELLAYSSLSDARDAALGTAAEGGAGARRGDGSGSGDGSGGGSGAAAAEWLRAAAAHPLADLGMGAAAGAAAVVVSMPADTVKTVIEHAAAAGCNATHGAGGGALTSARAFGATARDLVARGGAGALFAGMPMRLAEQVPSTALYWCAVEGMRRALAPFVAKEQ